MINKNKIQWQYQTEYVEHQTGEIIPRKEKNKYIILKTLKDKRYETKYIDNDRWTTGKITTTYICRRKPEQLEIEW